MHHSEDVLSKSSSSSSSTMNECSSNSAIHSSSNHENNLEIKLLEKILAKRREIYELELKKVQLERENSRKNMIDSGNESHPMDYEVSPYLQYPSSTLLSLLQNHEEQKEEDHHLQHQQEQDYSIAMLTESTIPKHCVPIRTDVRNMDWKALGNVTQFDVILMDPPWQLATSNPLRGVAISYKPLSDKHIQNMDINSLQDRNGGFLFIWVINAKYIKTLEMIENWGYTYVDEITWVKRTIHRRLAKGHGYYFYVQIFPNNYHWAPFVQ